MFLPASKNHRGGKYDIDHQMVAKDGETVKDTNKLDMQKRIDEANLQIASVNQAYLHINFNQTYHIQIKCFSFCSCNNQFTD